MLNRSLVKPCSGFALVEALVAALLLGLGLLGIIGLQTRMLGEYRDSKFRQYAVVMAGDLVDRIRANRTGATSYDTTSGVAAEDKACASTVSGHCTLPQHVAADDLHDWLRKLASLGFDATATDVAVNASVSPTIVTVTLGWEYRGGTETVVVKAELL